VAGNSTLRYVAAANEGDGIAIAAGAALGGIPGVVMMQNSGLGNAINPLTSLTYTFRLPVLLIVTLRGEQGGSPDEPQHELMGQITGQLLTDIGIPWEYFPTDHENIAPCLVRASAYMQIHGRPYALVMRKDSVTPWQTVASSREKPVPVSCSTSRTPKATRERHEFLRLIQTRRQQSELLVATTGYTGRELYALGDDEHQFYMVGSMGCAASFGLGLALVQPRRRIIVLDGDGATLMRLGALACIGWQHPDNLLHLVFDNGQYESTGGQTSAHPGLDIAGVAALCGYRRVAHISQPDELASFLDGPQSGPVLVQIATTPGVLSPLPRPAVTPETVARRMQALLAGGGAS
jgi:phosphonopyruvate decarboxylase